jgi:hypothetical protein
LDCGWRIITSPQPDSSNLRRRTSGGRPTRGKIKVCAMRIVETNRSHGRANAERGWLDLEQIATVEVTSEDQDSPSIRFSDRIRARAGALLKKVNSKSGSSLINLGLCIASSSALSSYSVNEPKSSPFDGHQQTAGRRRRSYASSGISGAPPAKSKIMRLIWMACQCWNWPSNPI